MTAKPRFADALKENDISTRNELIEAEINDMGWENELNDEMEHGGFPDDVIVEDIEIEDTVSAGVQSIEVTVDISFKESVASSCHDYNHEHPASAKAVVSIDPDGNFTIDLKDVDIRFPGDMG